MLVSAAIDPYRKSYGKARSRSPMAAGSWASERRTASPRYTWVPGVQAYAAFGSNATSRTAAPRRPAARSAARPMRRRVLDPEPAPLAAERLTEVAKLVLDEAVDPFAGLAHRL